MVGRAKAARSPDKACWAEDVQGLQGSFFLRTSTRAQHAKSGDADIVFKRVLLEFMMNVYAYFNLIITRITP